MGASWGRLGASWEHLGSPNLPRYDFKVNFPWILAPISTLGTTKIIDFSLFFQCFLGFRGFQHKCRLRMDSGVNLAPFWCGLGSQNVSWERLGASWSVLGASWGRLGASWGRLGASWARLEGVLEASWDVLGASWEHLGSVLEKY